MRLAVALAAAFGLGGAALAVAGVAVQFGAGWALIAGGAACLAIGGLLAKGVTHV